MRAPKTPAGRPQGPVRRGRPVLPGLFCPARRGSVYLGAHPAFRALLSPGGGALRGIPAARHSRVSGGVGVQASPGVDVLHGGAGPAGGGRAADSAGGPVEDAGETPRGRAAAGLHRGGGRKLRHAGNGSGLQRRISAEHGGPGAGTALYLTFYGSVGINNPRGAGDSYPVSLPEGCREIYVRSQGGRIPPAAPKGRRRPVARARLSKSRTGAKKRLAKPVGFGIMVSF